MLIDITLNVTPAMMGTAWENTAKNLIGHLGTHFDVMDKEFPLEYTRRSAVVFDVSHIRGREIEISDISLAQVKEDTFVAFCTGFMEEEMYGTSRYFKEHPQLSHALIEALLNRNISVIGTDCAGIRSGAEHVPADQRCAERGVFLVENLCSLKTVLNVSPFFTAHTYPMRVSGITGLPCRVVAELDI